MKPREEVKVEASDAHDGVISESLVRNKEIGGGIPDKGKVVVSRSKRLEEGGTGSKERYVLDIGIVFRLVGDKVVNVVTTLPPSDGKTTAKVGDEHANQSVNHKVGSNGQMTSVVGSKHDLMLQKVSMSDHTSKDDDNIPKTNRETRPT